MDPACGSGTFLAMAIKRKTIENSGMEKEALIHEILSTITGFDLNPIAVIASKTNYLLALGDLTAIEVPVKIPIFQADSILTPAVTPSRRRERPRLPSTLFVELSQFRPYQLWNKWATFWTW